MVQINFASREVSCKIVYYGPGRCGKTTNLQIVHAKAPPTSTGEMVSIATKGDRTLYFDFLSLDLGTVAGMRTRFHLYTVPGQVYYDQTRKLVLQGADGIVFIADSAPTMMQENIESLDNLAKNLHENGLDINDIPLVLQWNKRDLPGTVPVEELNKALNRNNWPTFEAIAVKGNGVFQTLKGIAQQVIRKLNREQGYSDDGKTRREDAQSLAAPPPPPPPPAAAPTRPVKASNSRPAASAPPPVSAPQAPRSQVAPPNVPKTAPTGGPPAAPAAPKLPSIQPRSQPAPKPAEQPPEQPAAQPRLAPPPPGSAGADARTPARQPAVPESAPAQVPRTASPPKPAKAAPKPAKAAPKPAKAAPKPAKAAPKPTEAAPKPAEAAPEPAPPQPKVQPSPTATPAPAPAPKPGSSPAPRRRTAVKSFKVQRYPPLPEDLEDEAAEVPEAAQEATPVPAEPAAAAPPAPKSSGSFKSVLLLLLLLALAGAAVAVYQFVIKGN
jgi:signal recognition particle receptor subunit beta